MKIVENGNIIGRMAVSWAYRICVCTWRARAERRSRRSCSPTSPGASCTRWKRWQ